MTEPVATGRTEPPCAARDPRLFLDALEALPRDLRAPSGLVARAGEVAACLREGRPWQPDVDSMAAPEDALFARAVAAATQPEGTDALVRLGRCGRAFDFLGDPGWNGLGWEQSDPRRKMLHCVRAAARILRGTTGRTPALIVTSIRNEGPRLLEWVAYHRAIGLHELLVYSNNNTDGSDALLHALAARGLITWIDNDCGPEVSPQVKAFEHALLFSPATLGARRAAFLDADEYLVLGEGGAGPADALRTAFAAEHDGRRIGALALHWRWFTHEGRYAARQGPLAAAYVRARTDEHVKCVVDLCATFSMRKVHLPVFGPGHWAVMDADGEPHDERRGPEGRALRAGQVNHYWTASFLDYALKKQRGRGAVAASAEQRAFGQFFDWGSPRHCPDEDLRIRPMLPRQAAEMAALMADSAIRRAQNEIQAIYAETMARLSADEALRRIYLDGCARAGFPPVFD